MLKRPDQSGHAAGYVKTMVEQAMIANFDYVFILSSLNDNFNSNRILRYVSLVLQGGGTPVVVLTKADLCENVEKYVQEIRNYSEEVGVHVISSITGDGLSELKNYLVDGVTVAFLGSSGVGKSTLVNALLGEERMKTGGIREKDSKGRHTTTSRELIVTENGITIIDTPGMCDVNEGIAMTFSEIEEMARRCRFSNCSHSKEPGCAIRQALESGELTEEK